MPFLSFWNVSLCSRLPRLSPNRPEILNRFQLVYHIAFVVHSAEVALTPSSPHIHVPRLPPSLVLCVLYPYPRKNPHSLPKHPVTRQPLLKLPLALSNFYIDINFTELHIILRIHKSLLRSTPSAPIGEMQRRRRIEQEMRRGARSGEVRLLRWTCQCFSASRTRSGPSQPCMETRKRTNAAHWLAGQARRFDMDVGLPNADGMC